MDEEIFPAPERLSEDARGVWRDTVARMGTAAARVVGPELEMFCEAVATAREARARIAKEGMIVADPRGVPMHHPALTIAQKAESTVERLSPRFQPKVSRRNGGYVVAKTRTALAAAGLDRQERFAGQVAAVLSLALTIDRAQEEGWDSFRRMAYGPLQSYMAALKDLGLSPQLAAVVAAPAKAGAVGDDESPRPVTSLDGWLAGRAEQAG